MSNGLEKTISLYKYILELSRLRQRVDLNTGKYKWAFYLADIPIYKDYVNIFYRDREEGENYDEDITILRVSNPEFTKCVEPPRMIRDWLGHNWERYTNEVKIRLYEGEDVFGDFQTLYKEYKEADKDSRPQKRCFFDSDLRVQNYKEWIASRQLWVEEQRTIEKVRRLFSDLYLQHIDLERESETFEMIVADGILLDREDNQINHPILTKRVKTRYDAEKNIMLIEDTDTESDLYTTLIRSIKNIDYSKISEITRDVVQNAYHPLDRNDIPQFFNTALHLLTSDSKFVGERIPDDWKNNYRLVLFSKPIFIVRKKLDGTAKTVEAIISDLEEKEDYPMHIKDIVSGGLIDFDEEEKEESLEERLAAVGGESVDILLSKEANREQLEIAKRIERYNAVIVQGPPGTGKTHTIANLLGHFLAQGKSVLVTSHTKKALSVLKEKVPSGIRSMCVSVLEDSNKDMEESIDGITDYMANHTSHSLQNKMNKLAVQREEVIKELAKNREKIAMMLRSEYESIVLFGKSYSPSEAAKLVDNNKSKLSIIPGHIKKYAPLPLTDEELLWLYNSNGLLSKDDEEEITYSLPDPVSILDADELKELLGNKSRNNDRIQRLANEKQWKISINYQERIIELLANDQLKQISFPKPEMLTVLSDAVEKYDDIRPWMKMAILDGKTGGAHKNKWLTLIKQIEEINTLAEQVISDSFVKEIQFTGAISEEELEKTLIEIKEQYVLKGKLGKLYLSLHSDAKKALDEVSIDNKRIQSADNCIEVINFIHLKQQRRICSQYWNKLIGESEGILFDDLGSEPEKMLLPYIPHISYYLGWYENVLPLLKKKISDAEFDYDQLFALKGIHSDEEHLEHLIKELGTSVPAICELSKWVLENEGIILCLKENRTILHSEQHRNSKICSNLARALENEDIETYSSWKDLLNATYSKSSTQIKRKELLNKLRTTAPEWAQAIQNRFGIHGESLPPENIQIAWTIKQLNEILTDLLDESIGDLQKKNTQLGKDYRKATAQYAEKSAWYHLLNKTERDIDLKQALQGWKQTVKKIGKGTGKNAPKYKAQARILMGQCQAAVPAWIMPIGKALESLDPRVNKFDIVIIDEASQADVSALAIAYLAKKLIIVGDDKQVSPMGIGVETDRISALQEMYLNGKIPNAHLFDATTSIYDIAATTFPPLMLREHFRCVPDIIGFSNMLSYDYKIKPLRDAGSSNLIPAVINYRVRGGARRGTINQKEAEKTVALMKACLERKEYKNKTFGVISLLKEDQALLVQRLINEHISRKTIEERRILCGISSNFQGDERDVIFLNMVDSNDNEGPLALQGYGVLDSAKKRYNVAVSRAKDQLWVINSLDPASDLKPGDIRKELLDYSLNPHAFDKTLKEVAELAESPFEESVASALVKKGYQIEQQRPVGGYRLDIVVMSNNHKIAIECDGDRYHSGEDKIREDMERQTILERSGWQFIRIRGSEYYRDQDQTIERIARELEEHDIHPEMTSKNNDIVSSSELLNAIEQRAYEILAEEFGYDEEWIEDPVDVVSEPEQTTYDTELILDNRVLEEKEVDQPYYDVETIPVYEETEKAKKEAEPSDINIDPFASLRQFKVRGRKPSMENENSRSGNADEKATTTEQLSYDTESVVFRSVNDNRTETEITDNDLDPFALLRQFKERDRTLRTREGFKGNKTEKEEAEYEQLSFPNTDIRVTVPRKR